MDEYQQIFINNLKYYRALKGLSQSKFAEECNVSTGTIGNIECGLSKPSFDLIIIMSKVLNIEPYNLFDNKNQNSDENKKNHQSNILKEHSLLVKIYEELNSYFK